MAQKLADKKSFFILTTPFYGLWLAFWLVPIILGIDLSVQNPDRIVSHWTGADSFSIRQNGTSFSWNLNSAGDVRNEKSDVKYVGLANYEKVLSDAKFYKALKNTFYYVSGSVLIILPLAFALSICLFQLSRTFRGLLVFCLMIPGLALPGVISTLFYLFFHGKTGALNQYIIMPLGFDPVNWMMDPDFIMPSLIMQSVWRWTGLVTLFFICGLEAIPRWQFEAAKIEGVDGLQKIRQVLIPNLYHLAVFATVFLVVDGFASFSGAYNLLGGSGGIMDAGLLLVTYVYQVAFPGGSGQFDFPGAAAMSLLVVPVTSLLLFLVLQNRRRLLLR